ncbi:ABC transporter ATP-binding protein [Actinomadura roseirufa]|uniref:ABC transporter ATP-binding protein n=1 Tax=Actinomadura roseirufa TaxID=2094049 RepID=UPI001040ED8A|nr:ABC transporter ATP-binding protein [Actinomadura roseirufa]
MPSVPTERSAASGPVIELDGATKHFGPAGGGVRTAVRDLHLCVGAGEFVAVVGPAGCGKSTALALVAGLEEPSAGRALVRGVPVDGVPDGVGYLFQNDPVLPWRTVLDNVALGPRYRGASRREARGIARDWVARAGLAGYERHYPHQLPAGMRKRVALAQTLANEPSVLLMDEPFSALDPPTRGLMQDELLRLWSGSGAAVLFATRDLEEALVLADRVVVMTAAPATVRSTFDVPLERPIDAARVRLAPEFRALDHEVRESLREEVQITGLSGAGYAA